jgi:hypothetical protein
MMLFAPKWVELVGEQRKLHKNEFHYLNCSGNNIHNSRPRKIWWAGKVTYVRRENACRVWVGKPKAKGSLE